MGLRGHVYVPYDLSIGSSLLDPSNRGIEVLLSFSLALLVPPRVHAFFIIPRSRVQSA